MKAATSQPHTLPGSGRQKSQLRRPRVIAFDSTGWSRADAWNAQRSRSESAERRSPLRDEPQDSAENAHTTSISMRLIPASLGRSVVNISHHREFDVPIRSQVTSTPRFTRSSGNRPLPYGSADLMRPFSSVPPARTARLIAAGYIVDGRDGFVWRWVRPAPHHSGSTSPAGRFRSTTVCRTAAGRTGRPRPAAGCRSFRLHVPAAR